MQETQIQTTQIKMNVLTLQFPGELEKDFLRHYFQKSIQQVRFSYLIGLAFFGGFGILDALMIPEQQSITGLIRYGIVCPLVLGIYIFSYFRPFRRCVQEATSLAILIGGLGVVAMPVFIQSSYFDNVYVGLILVLLFAYTITRLRFIYATATGWIIVIAYEIVAIWVSRFPIVTLLNINFGLISANLIGMFSSYLLELYIRREFLQTRLLEAEREKSERLLLNILPHAIAEQLKQEQMTIADNFAEATVLFADIAGFTQLSTKKSPTELVNLLNQIFSAFDQLADQHGLEKIKTIGDAYMVVGGLPIPRPDHAEAMAEMALDMQARIIQFNTETGEPFSMRIGINTGPVVAGVIGIKKFIYDLWGDTVNIASRMESQGIPGQIQVTAATYDRLSDKYLFEERGTIHVKGKGEMRTYLLTGRKVPQKDHRVAAIG